MKVKCVLCDYITNIEDESISAKKLRNRPIHTYMCESCYDRITQRTMERVNTGHFNLYRDKKIEDDW